ncbi:unnamed protein product [Scytosiphon promiscuus]
MREKPLRHWEDPTLLHMVYQDLLRNDGWTALRPISLDLPPCACCHQDSNRGHQSQETRRTSRASVVEGHRCGSIAHGIAGRVEEDANGHHRRNGDDGPEAETVALTKLVFAVNAGCALPTRRFSDVVAAAEECLLRWDAGDTAAARDDERNLRSRFRVLAAFCDGSSIIYYSASTGIET